ncbi:MAG TPA: hypothetical protein VGC62_06245 [Pseudomonas sp.]
MLAHNVNSTYHIDTGLLGLALSLFAMQAQVDAYALSEGAWQL